MAKTKTNVVQLIGETAHGTDIVGAVDLPLRFGAPKIILYRGRVFMHYRGRPAWEYIEAYDAVRVVGKKIERM